MSNDVQRNFDLNMNFNGMMPSTGGGGQFPLTGVDGAPPFHVARIADMTKEVNSKSTGEIVKVKLEGVSGPVQGLTHTVTMNIAHADPQVAKRGAQDMFALVYAATGMMQIGNVSQLMGKNVGVTIRLDPSNKEGENYTRLDHFVFVDGRDLVVNGQLQPMQAQAGNFNGGGNGGQNNGNFNPGNNGNQNNGGGFSTGGQNNGGGQQQQNNGQGQGQNFNSGAQVQGNSGFSTGTMPNPNGNQGQGQGQNNGGNNNGYDGAPNFNNGGNNNGGGNGQGQGDRPNWSTGA